MTETRIADLDWIPSDMNYSWEGHKQCHAQVEKKNPKYGINTRSCGFTLCAHIPLSRLSRDTARDWRRFSLSGWSMCCVSNCTDAGIFFALSATVFMQVKFKVLFASRVVPVQLTGSSWI